MRNTLEGINSRVDEAKDLISYLEGIVVSTQTERKKEENF